MESSELQFLNLTSEDLNSFEHVAETYFNTIENDKESETEAGSESSESDSSDNDVQEDDVELMEVYISEQSKVQKFYADTCKCKLGTDEKACSLSLTVDEFVDCRNNCIELSSAELDLVILGIIHSCLNCDDISISSRKENMRKNDRMAYFYHGKRICMRTFLFLHNIHRYRFYSLVKHYKKNGLTLRVHGNSKRLPSCACSSETVEHVIKFINNVAEEQALLLPGRVPGFKRIDVKLLPSNLTKHGLWKTYSDVCTSLNQISVGYSKFCDLWNQLCPFILIMRPATDLCWTCQKNNNQIRRTTNLPEAEKAEAVKKQQEHLRISSGEREQYKKCCEEQKRELY